MPCLAPSSRSETVRRAIRDPTGRSGAADGRFRGTRRVIPRRPTARSEEGDGPQGDRAWSQRHRVDGRDGGATIDAEDSRGTEAEAPGPEPRGDLGFGGDRPPTTIATTASPTPSWARQWRSARRRASSRSCTGRARREPLAPPRTQGGGHHRRRASSACAQGGHLRCSHVKCSQPSGAGLSLRTRSARRFAFTLSAHVVVSTLQTFAAVLQQMFPSALSLYAMHEDRLDGRR